MPQSASKKQNRKLSKKLDKLSNPQALERNMSKLTKEVQAANNSTDDNTSVALIVPGRFSFGGEMVPGILPLSIRQAFYDLRFLRNSLLDAAEDLLAQRALILGFLIAWDNTRINGGNETWEWARANIHNLSDFQNYERLRNDMRANYLEIGRRLEEKIYEHFETTNDPRNSTAKIRKILKVGERTKVHREYEFEKRCSEYSKNVSSVNKMMDRLEDLTPLNDEELNGLDIDWWKTLLAGGPLA